MAMSNLNVKAEVSKPTKMVMIRATAIHNYNNGLFGIEVPCREITKEERQAIDALFPNLTTQAYELLDKESLIQSLFTGELPESPRHDRIVPQGVIRT